MVNVDTPTIEMSILLLSVCLVYALAYAFVKYFSAKDYSHPLSNAVVTFALTSSLMCILLIPADVMGSSNKQRFQMEERNLKTAYYGLYVCLVVTVFIIVPFAYFFVEDSDNEDEDGIQPDFKERCASASKSTFMVLLLVVVFVLVALLVGTSKGHHELSDQKHVVKWLTALMEGVDGGFWERLLMLCVGLLTTIGLANYVLYTSYGLFALPITLIRGSKKLEDEQDLVEMDRLQIRLKKMRLQQKYAKKGGKVSSAHARELAKLEKEEKLLKYQQAGLQALSEDWSYRCWRCIAPVRVMVGCCLIVFSSLVFVSLLLSTMDRQMNSLCGMRCGYVVDSPQIFNPLDRLLMLLAKFFSVRLRTPRRFSSIFLSHIAVRHCLHRSKVLWRASVRDQKRRDLASRAAPLRCADGAGNARGWCGFAQLNSGVLDLRITNVYPPPRSWPAPGVHFDRLSPTPSPPALHSVSCTFLSRGSVSRSNGQDGERLEGRVLSVLVGNPAFSSCLAPRCCRAGTAPC